MDNTDQATPAKRKPRAVSTGRSSKAEQSIGAGSATDKRVVGKSRVKKSGGSLITTIPIAARNLAHVEDGQEWAFSVEGRRIIMEPVEKEKPVRVRRPRYTLDELLDGSNPDVPMTDEEKAWDDAPAMGREAW
ncbi:hypothetical protein [Fodinicurvata sp. EGI_FJ10296]|uniref:AbrB/MazE/SpoVT family DNA-binding domain-containing protein n=1 Tax=Fodinicurvata sp. EGI_FJ10296 TaxID=3231908 RepID=UPI003452F89B